VDCIFCDIISGKKSGFFIYESQDHVAILDKYPIDTGHSLVMPREHHEKITDMTEKNFVDLFSRVPKIAKAILQATNADAFSIAQNNGRAAKQIVPHVHVHIIPRYDAKETVWTKRQIPKDEELEVLAQKIRQNLDSKN